jgi:hypothetical protein
MTIGWVVASVRRHTGQQGDSATVGKEKRDSLCGPGRKEVPIS